MSETLSYRQRSGYSQAIVTLADSATEKRRDYWLGERGFRESREAFHRLIVELKATRDGVASLRLAQSRCRTYTRGNA